MAFISLTTFAPELIPNFIERVNQKDLITIRKRINCEYKYIEKNPYNMSGTHSRALDRWKGVTGTKSGLCIIRKGNLVDGGGDNSECQRTIWGTLTTLQ